MKAKIFTKLLYRHWASYTEFKRSHLFVVSAEADASQPNSARDLTPGDHDVPPFNLGGQDMYAVSPDGQELAYTSNIDEVEATSTNNEIFIVPMAGGTPKKISTSPGKRQHAALFAGWKTHRLALDGARRFRGRQRIARSFISGSSGKMRNATEKFDRSVGSFDLDAGFDMRLFFTAEDHGEAPIYALPLDGERQPNGSFRGCTQTISFFATTARLFSSRRVSVDGAKRDLRDLTFANEAR